MTYDFSDAKPSEIEFKDHIHGHRWSEIFLVQIRGTTCVMKVHRDEGPINMPEYKERDIHVCEVNAYRRLMQHGLGDLGIIPRYYGEIRHLNVKDYQPHLRKFLQDKYPPSAVFLEYIPNMEMFTWEKYTERAQSMIHGAERIHEALVLHADVYLRNIMVIRDDPGRVIWIDFDRADTYDAETITEEEKGWIEDEGVIVSEIADALKIDSELGKVQETLISY